MRQETVTELKNIADYVLKSLKDYKAEKAKCDAGCSVTHEFNVDGGEFSLFRTLYDKHLLLTVIKDRKKGEVRLNNFDEEAIKEAIKNSIETAESSVPDEAWDIAPLVENKDFKYGAVIPDLDRLFDRCEELINDIKTRFPKIIIEQMIVSHCEIKNVHANTNGVLFSEHYGRYKISIMFSAHENEKTSSFFDSCFVTDSLDKPFIACGSVEKDLSDIEKQIITEAVEGKYEGVMILTPASLKGFVSDIFGNFASGNKLIEGTTPWKGCIGQRVADKSVTLSLMPRDERIICGEKITGDGFESWDYDVIKDGVLKNFLISLYAANKTGEKISANSSNSIVMKNGDKKLSEIISQINMGIIVGRFSGGEPSSNGDFSGIAKNSFLIENGKITKSLSETMISGNLADMLNNVRAVSYETVSDGTSVLPYVAFNGICISGK